MFSRNTFSKCFLQNSTLWNFRAQSTREITFNLYDLRRKFLENTVNRFKNDRVNWLGPDLACLEWLMKCGSTSVTMSNGAVITSNRQMRYFIKWCGFKLSGRVGASNEPLHTEVIKKFDRTLGEGFAIDEDPNYDEMWKHLPPFYIEEVDATDSVIADPGFRYFSQCRQIKKMRLNFCDYFSDLGMRELALGRTAMTVVHLEIIGNYRLTDASLYWLARMRGLKHLHLYSIAFDHDRKAIMRQLKLALPACTVTFPAMAPLVKRWDHISQPTNLMKQYK